MVGAGCIGQFVCQIASFMGGEVFLCDINRERLRISEKIMTVKGIIYEDNWDNILPETYDTVIDLAGVVGMEDKLINVCRQRGKVLFIAGRFHVHYTFNLAQIREITVKHNNHFTVDDLKEVCELVQKGIIKIEPLIKDIVPVNEAKRIYDTLRDEPHKLLGTVFVW